MTNPVASLPSLSKTLRIRFEGTQMRARDLHVIRGWIGDEIVPLS